MLRLPLALALLSPLLCACEGKDDSSSGDGSSSSSGSASAPTASVGETGGATEVSGQNSDSAATEVTTGDEPETTANSVTTPPMTDPSTLTDPNTMTEPTTMTTETVTSANPTDPTGADPDEGATQMCVDTINMYRATLGLPALARWTDAEDCSDAECVSDGMSGTPHGAFGMCGEGAQNECPGWGGPPEAMINDCLAVMWAEGPGDDFQKHGHYINMSNPGYTKVACGFAEVNGEIWAVQNFQ